MVKINSEELRPHTEKIYLDQICRAIVNCGGNPFILTFDDFPYIPYILEYTQGVLFYPGTDLPPFYYKEENRASYLHRDSYSTFLMNQAIYD